MVDGWRWHLIKLCMLIPVSCDKDINLFHCLTSMYLKHEDDQHPAPPVRADAESWTREQKRQLQPRHVGSTGCCVQSSFNTSFACSDNETELFFICCLTREVYDQRIASYRKKFQSHQEYYLQNPTAQKLLRLQAEKEEIEFRIKVCDDQITMKQAELDHLTGNTLYNPLVTCSAWEYWNSSLHCWFLWFCLTRSSSHCLFHWEATGQVSLSLSHTHVYFIELFSNQICFSF